MCDIYRFNMSRVNIGAATHKLSSYNAQSQMSRGFLLARLWSFGGALVFSLGKTHTSNQTPTFFFFSHPESPEPSSNPSAYALYLWHSVYMFLHVSRRPWLNTVLVCVCVVQGPVSHESLNIPFHPVLEKGGPNVVGRTECSSSTHHKFSQPVLFS